MTPYESLHEVIRAGASALGGEAVASVKLEVPPRAEMGDYSTNAALVLAKVMGLQPREVAGLTRSLEIPAGKLDVEGEAPLQAAQRELAEEIGMQAARWQELKAFYTSAGFSDERITCYLAQELTPAPDVHSDEDERIEIVPWPLTELDAAIDECEDAKSVIALLWLARARASSWDL